MRHVLVLSIFLTVPSLWSQHKLDSRTINERIVAVVPLIGAGTFEDPKRPLFVPAESALSSRDGIIGFNYQLTDDGRSAIVEFVFTDRKALLPMLRDSRLAGRVFERGKTAKADVERELRKHKKDFSIDDFQAAVGR